MYDALQAIGDAWREVEHISEWTGMSIGMLLVCAGVIYAVPTWRGAAIHAAIVVVAGYMLAIWCYHVGASDRQAKWDAQNRRVAAALGRRDVDAAKAALNQEAVDASDLKTEATKDQGIVDALKKSDAVCHPITADELR